MLGLSLKLASAALVIWLVVALSGCASRQMEKVFEVEGTYVRWIRQAPTRCGNKPEDTGCAYTSQPYTKEINNCTIVADFDVPDFVLGHELRHCMGERHFQDIQR